MITSRQHLLHLRVLALRNVRTGYEPHMERIQSLCRRGARRTGAVEDQINHLAWKYRRQISPELVPCVCGDEPVARL